MRSLVLLFVEVTGKWIMEADTVEVLKLWRFVKTGSLYFKNEKRRASGETQKWKKILAMSQPIWEEEILVVKTGDPDKDFSGMNRKGG